MRGRVIILHAMRYDFKDEATGRPVTGAKFDYADEEPIQSENEVGLILNTAKAAYRLFHDLKVCPGIYEVEAVQRKSSAGNKTEFVDIKFIQDLTGEVTPVPLGMANGAKP